MYRAAVPARSAGWRGHAAPADGRCRSRPQSRKCNRNYSAPPLDAESCPRPGAFHLHLEKFDNTDTEEEIEFVRNNLEKKNIEVSLVEGWAKGGEGATDIAKKIIDLANKKSDFKLIYDDNDSIKTKIEKVATKIYGASKVKFLEEALINIDKIEKLGKSDFPVCIAKTQYSLSDDEKNLQCNEPFEVTVRDVALKNGAEFIVVYSGKILTMPGLPKIPAAENIYLDENEDIVGIF